MPAGVPPTVSASVGLDVDAAVEGDAGVQRPAVLVGVLTGQFERQLAVVEAPAVGRRGRERLLVVREVGVQVAVDRVRAVDRVPVQVEQVGAVVGDFITL